MKSANAGFKVWSARSNQERADILRRAADMLENQASRFHYLAVREAGKTWQDAIDEVREAVDFCRYYAARAQDEGFQAREALGIIVCISPWNFPLAIFLGQVTAALAAGNAVIAKPAEQTPLIAAEAVQLLIQAGVDRNAIALLPGDGATIGNALVKHPETAGVCFTGSTATAKAIAKALARSGKPLAPLIAETGGLNAMIVDSSALLEQTVDAVVDSAFQSAGQRCSALRILCVQEDIADEFEELLSGAMAKLHVGDPWQLDTDVGPVIDAEAHQHICGHVASLEEKAKRIGGTMGEIPKTGFFIAPTAFELDQFAALEEEIFGPVLHLVRFPASQKMRMIEEINNSGYGLTLGINSRIDGLTEAMADQAEVGNIYINRNQIGAVVGVQPFGGHGLSGTGPKAGGPLYLLRLSKPGSGIDEIGTQVGDPAHCPPASKAMLADRAVPLPSPAGETNSYTSIGRGKILCLMSGTVEMADTCIRAMQTGNHVVLVREPGAAGQSEDMVTRLRNERPNAEQLEIISLSGKALDELIRNGKFQALLADPKHPDLAHFAELLSDRKGPIIPILTSTDTTDRFVHEKTITNNVAAAGGDVALLNT